MKKRGRRFWSFLLVLAMLVTTVGQTGIGEISVWAAEETKDSEKNTKSLEAEENSTTMEDAARELRKQGKLKTWSDVSAFLEKFLSLSDKSKELEEYLGKEMDWEAKVSNEDWQKLCEKIWTETIFSEKEAEEADWTTGKENLLVMAEKATVTGAKARHISVFANETFGLKEAKAESVGIFGETRTELTGTILERLTLLGDKKDAFLRLSQDTEIPEIYVYGGKEVTIEGNASLGLIRVTKAPETLTVRATASVKNESGEVLHLIRPDGTKIELADGEQEELVLTSYLVTFRAEDEVLETRLVKPGNPVDYPEKLPEKEGKIFTSWYQDENFTEPASQFENVNGQLTFYARYVNAEDAVTVTFETFDGDPLKPQFFAKGENLLSKPVTELYTRKEGYTFGGWCRDEACTESFSYTEPIEENLTLYAFFTSDEVQVSEKDGSSVDRNDFDWQGEILLAAEEGMTKEEVEGAIRLEAGSGDLEPAITLKETADGFSLSGTCYEKDGEKGFEPGSTVSVILSEGVHFAGYSEDVDTMVLYIYKEEIEIVDFSDTVSYELWNQVVDYTPVIFYEDEDSSDEELDEEIEKREYDPGKIVVKTDTEYQKGDIVVFYDGEIGRDEQNIEAYTEGSFDGYVLFAEVLDVRKTGDGTQLSFGYADPESYLSDLDVHVTEDVAVDEELNEADLELLSSKISSQVDENEELKAQMIVAVMSSKETQDMIDEMYGEGVYSLASMNAALKTEKPSVALSVSGSTVTAQISVGATATIRKDGKVILTVRPKLSFTQSLTVQTNVNGGKIWLDMSLTLRSTSKIALTISAASGGNTGIFEKAAESMKEIIKPEGIRETDDYDAYDKSVHDLMDVMQSVVSASLVYNDLFTVRLLTLKFSFYGIITLGVDVDFVGQIGVLATFGVEIVISSGERIGFKYNFLKFKGSSYTQKLESSVTTNIYLIGKVGVRLGIRLTLSITLCGIARASVTGSLYAYAELTGMYFFTANLLTGANTGVGALNFEVGIDVSVSLGLQVKLIFKTIKKNWTVYKGRWPLWSTSVSSNLSYMDAKKLDEMWEKSTVNADKKTSFGFQTVPMKTWTLMTGSCMENELLWEKNRELELKIENLTVNGEKVSAGDPKEKLFLVGDPSKGQNPGMIYMDEKVAAEYICEKAELDVVLTYESSSGSAMVKKQVRRFHLSKKCSVSTTTQKVQVKLYDWCAHAWGLETAAWDQAVVYEDSFEASHMIGGLSEPTATGNLNLNAAASAAQNLYPELQGMDFSWMDPSEKDSIQYSSPRISNFCYLTVENGVVRFDVFKETKNYEVTYYLYVKRFSGDGSVNYHVKLTNPASDTEYAFCVYPSLSEKALDFEKEADGSWKLSAKRAAFNGEKQPLLMASDGAEPVKTGFSITGREKTEDVWYEITLGNPKLEMEIGEGIRSVKFADESIVTESGIRPGTEVRLNVNLKEGYSGVNVSCEDPDMQFRVEEDQVIFTMPTYDLKITLTSYRYHTLTFVYNYSSYGIYKTVSVREDKKTEEPANPYIDGLTFCGWYEKTDGSGKPFSFGEKLVSDQTVYADWNCNVTIDFGAVKGQALYLDGEEIKSVFDGDEKEYFRFTYSTQRIGEKLLDIQVPDYPGYEFTGWYTDAEAKGTPVDVQNRILTGGLVLYAGWVRLIPVTFERNDPDEDSETGSYANTVVREGELLSELPEAPVREHYEFTGWYKDPKGTEAFDPEKEKITEELTLYAGWEAEVYSITYELGGVKEPEGNPKSYTTKDSVILVNPVREGYEFTGWTGTGLAKSSKEVKIPRGSSGERWYIAHWKPVRYKLSYELVRGVLSEANPDSYTVESNEIILKNPVLEKYKFTGWIGTDLTEPTMEVRILKGSLGDRSYRATWETEDPAEKIADIALEAAGMAFESRIEDLPLSEEENLDIRVLEAVQEFLQTALEQDERIQAYLDAISLTVAQEEKPEMEDALYHYTYHITVVYKDDAGAAYVRENADYKAEIYKNQTEVEIAPQAGKLSYGQSLKESELVGGRVRYGEIEVPGTFSWLDETIVPWGGDNENNIYPVLFTPDEEAAKIYTSCEVMICVQTQIGVNAEFTADSRDYIKDSKKATGTWYLVDADRGILYEELKLTGGEAVFAQSLPGNDLSVVFFGYQLEEDEDGLYVLLNEEARSKADIRWISPTVETMPVVSKTVGGGTALRDVQVTGGKAVYQTAEGTFAEVPGSWNWDVPGHTISGEGEQEFTMTFVPEDTDGFRPITGVKVKINVTKRKIDPPVIGKLIYNGSLQKPEVEETGDYEVTENAGGISAGTYTVILKLKHPEYTVWSTDEIQADKNQTVINDAEAVISYEIQKADLAVAADPSGNGITVQKLGYGQELTDGNKEVHMVNQKEVVFRLCAQDMISGVQVTYEGNGTRIPVTGTWKWVLTGEEGTLLYSQPMNVGTYMIEAEFNPEESQRGNLNPVKYAFEVTVEQAVPDASGYSSFGIRMYQSSTSGTPLSIVEPSQSLPVNPNTGESVNGTWNWEDPEIIPEIGTKKYNITFTPSDAQNYTTVNAQKEVNASSEVSAYPILSANVSYADNVYPDRNPSRRLIMSEYGGTIVIDAAGTITDSMELEEITVRHGTEQGTYRKTESGAFVYENNPADFMTISYSRSLRAVTISLKRIPAVDVEVSIRMKVDMTDSYTLDMEETEVTVTLPKEEKESDTAAPAEEKKESDTAAPSEEEKTNDTAAPAEEKKESDIAVPTEEETENDAVAPPEEKKESDIAVPTEEETENDAVAPPEEKKEGDIAVPSEEETESETVAPAEDEKESDTAALPEAEVTLSLPAVS